MRRALLYLSFAVASAVWAWPTGDAYSNCGGACSWIHGVALWVPILVFPVGIGLLLSRSRVKPFEYWIAGWCCSGINGVAVALQGYTLRQPGDDTFFDMIIILTVAWVFATPVSTALMATTRFLTCQLRRKRELERAEHPQQSA